MQGLQNYGHLKITIPITTRLNMTSYDEARIISNLPTLHERRSKLCRSYFYKFTDAGHKLNPVLSARSTQYLIRSDYIKMYNTLPVPFAMTDRYRRSLIPCPCRGDNVKLCELGFGYL